MNWLEDLLTTHLILFTLVLARVGGLVTTAPLFSAVAVPANVRALLAFALALMVAPTQVATAFTPPDTSVDWLIAISFELLIGMALGLGTAMLVAGVQMAGQLIAQLSGLALAEVFDPGLDANVPVLSQLLGMFTIVVYLVIGGHRWLLAGLLHTFQTLPVGTDQLPASLTTGLLTIVSESFSLGIRTAAPVVVALLLATLILALLGRTLTQLNIMSVGFGLNSLVACGALAISLGSAALLFEDQLQPALDQLLEAIAAAPVSGSSLP